MIASRVNRGKLRRPPVRSAEDLQGNSTKRILAMQLNKIIELRGLSQTEAAKRIGMTQPKVSLIRNYRLENFSLERLIQALTALDQHVEIIIRPADNEDNAKITVAA
jgi:predicted XRE-type DNA-binding protein